MNSNLKNNKKRINLFTIFSLTLALFLSISLFPAVAQAKLKVVFFCTDWNAKCRDARKTINDDIAKYPGQVEYKEFNVDLNVTPDQARVLGLSMPDKIPFFVLLDKNGNVLYQDSYSTAAMSKFDSVLNSNIK
ncbi:MAG: hypothetical protein WCK67_01785 [bacterium]